MDVPEAGCSLTAQRLVEDQLDQGPESGHKDRMMLVYWREFYVSFIFLGVVLVRAQVLYWLALWGASQPLLAITKGLYLWVCLMLLCRSGIDANPMYTLLGCLRKGFQTRVQGELKGFPSPLRFAIDFVAICASVFVASVGVVYLGQLIWPELTARSQPPPRPHQIGKVEFICTLIQMMVQVYQPMYSKMFGPFASTALCCIFPCITDSVGASINPIMAIALVVRMPNPSLFWDQVWAYSVPPMAATVIVVGYEWWIYSHHMNELSGDLSDSQTGALKLKED